MSVQVRARREAGSFLASFVGAQGELLVDTTGNRVQVHDGVTPGGTPAAKLSEVITNTRTAVVDTAYTALPTDRTIAVTSLTAARTITLPAAAAYPTGTQLLVFDETGACSTSNALTVTRAGSDTINGITTAVIASAYGYLAFESNGATRWTVVDQTALAATSGTARTAVADASYAALSGDRVIAYTAISAARTVTLPSAAAFPVGTRLLVLDESGAASATATITLARTGTDTINGVASATISAAYGYVAVQSNGTGKWTITDVPGANASSASRTAVADASYTATMSDRLVAFTTLTAARTLTLPAGAAFATGVQLVVVDESGGCSATNAITVARSGSDTINGAGSAVIATAYGYLALESNGAGKWTVVDQVPTAGSGAGASRSGVRQTVQGGPAASGAPSFLPATSGSLSLTGQNVSSGASALTVAAAQGYNTTGQNDVVLQITSNPTWSNLTASATNYLFINASTGATGTTILQPIYQFGGTPSTVSGQFTFDTQAMIGSLGNGSTTVATPLVFVGEAITSASAVTSSIAYAYNGYFDSGFTVTLPGTNAVVSKLHNIGTAPGRKVVIIECTTADNGYAVGAQTSTDGGITGFNSAGNQTLPPSIVATRNNVTLAMPSGTTFAAENGAGSGSFPFLTAANWKYKFVIARGWGGA